MNGGRGLLPIFIIIVLTLGVSCKPINIFSPFVDPSKMGNEAKMDAGYNALSDGHYEEAVDYFTDVISDLEAGGASGDKIAEAYLGRAFAYVKMASADFGTVVVDVVSHTIKVEGSSEFMTAVVGKDGNYIDFFNNIQLAADDYNVAVENMGPGIDPGISFEMYHTNMMAATGVGTRKIAAEYNKPPWDGTTEDALNIEYADITDDRKRHPYNVGTWEDPHAENNGLSKYVDRTPAETEMMRYLMRAYGALEGFMDKPPLDMRSKDISGMHDVIIDWACYGLGDPIL